MVAPTERTRLLGDIPATDRRPLVYATEATQTSKSVDVEETLQRGETNRRRPRHLIGLLWLLILAVAATATTVKATWRRFKPVFVAIPRLSTSSLLGDALANTALVPTPTTHQPTMLFRDGAATLIPPWYDRMIQLVDTVLNETVQPGDVYHTRKTILFTRDLLDMFGPCAPPTHLWQDLRQHTAELYRTVGEFQDLHNAHVKGYTPAMLQEKRQAVLAAKDAFDNFRQTNPDIPAFLQEGPTVLSPDVDGTTSSSHLFWRDVEPLPMGDDGLTTSLHRLGVAQLRRAQTYLRTVLPESSILNSELVHAVFHNVRKELRSLTDEFNLLGAVMFGDTGALSWKQTKMDIQIFRQARRLLGDINDDWTAYQLYVQHDIEPLERERRRRSVDTKWKGFQTWVESVDLDGIMDHLASAMKADYSVVQSLFDFLVERQKAPTTNLVIGNEAGDADSIVSAIALAYIESLSTNRDDPKTPVVSIPKANLPSRPEVVVLLHMAGVVQPTDILVFVDDQRIANHSGGDRVTLTDHNTLSESLANKNWTVVEIVDHHEDMGLYRKTCSGKARTIAFASGRALVASACTLVAERLQTKMSTYPASIGLMLLGVILLDSVNLSKHVGKVTKRDRAAVKDLLRRTDWSSLSFNVQQNLNMTSSSASPDPNLVFRILQDAKYNPNFWAEISVIDSLRYDYKDYGHGRNLFGISTVLMPMDAFLSKPQLLSSLLEFMNESRIGFLAIMFAYQDKSGRLFRQLAVCSANPAIRLKQITSYLLEPKHHKGVSLDLKKVPDVELVQKGDLQLQLFNQHNVKPSRKQIGPILLDFFDKTR